MPWSIERRDSKWCVVKDDDGEVEGCHASRADAVKQQRALYASESATEVTEMSDTHTATVTVAGEVIGGDLVVSMAGKEISRQSVAELLAEDEATPWEGPLGLEGFATSDGRYLIPGEILERDLPLPLNVQMMTAEGHANSVNAGRIESVDHIPVGEFDRRSEFGLDDVPDTAIVIWGRGVFDNSEGAAEGQRMLANGAGVSLDLPPERFGLFDRETFEEVDADTVELEEVLSGKYLTGMGGKIAGATVVTIPAFEHAAIQIVDGQAIVASAMTLKVVDPGSLVAAAALAAPPLEWFEDPGLAGPTPLTYTAEGRVYGHLALWDSCHTGFPGVCVSPPSSPTNFSYFNVGVAATDKGPVTCGKLMYSESGGKHASLEASAAEASKHYDDATKVGAYVRAGSDSYGIWLAGALKPGVTDDVLEFLRLHPPSGDWRGINGASELVAAFSVPIPAFPIPHAEARLVASAGLEEIAALIIGPMQVEETPRAHRRKLRMLSDRAHRRR